MVTNCPNNTAVNLVLFYEFCLADALQYDLTAYSQSGQFWVVTSLRPARISSVEKIAVGMMIRL